MTLRPCGTEAAYKRHRRRGETPCAACREGRNDANLRRGVSQRRRTKAVHGTAARYQRGCRCDACREAKMVYKRALAGRNRPPVTMADAILDVLELNMTSMSLASLLGWVAEVHPEWAEDSIRRRVYVMAEDGRVVRVEFGDEIRYRLP